MNKDYKDFIKALRSLCEEEYDLYFSDGYEGEININKVITLHFEINDIHEELNYELTLEFIRDCLNKLKEKRFIRTNIENNEMFYIVYENSNFYWRSIEECLK